MSDIALPDLEWLLDAIYVGCITGPPVVLGLLFLLIYRFVPRSRVILVALYFVTSIGGVFGSLGWLSVWLNDPEVLFLALPFSIFGPALIFGVFLLLRLILRRVFNPSS